MQTIWPKFEDAEVQGAPGECLQMENLDRTVTDTTAFLTTMSQDMATRTENGKALFVRSTRLCENGKLGQAIVDIHAALECPLSTEHRKEASELMEHMLQKRYVTKVPLYRTYWSGDEPSTLLAFARHEVDNGPDEPFECLFDAHKELQGIRLRDTILDLPNIYVLEETVPPKETWSAGRAGAFTITAYEQSWIAEELRTRRNKKRLCNKTKGNKQWSKVTVLHCAEIPAGTEFPPEFWVEETAPGHYTLYPKPYQTRAVAVETKCNQLECATLSAIAVTRPHCVVLRAEGELPPIQGRDASTYDHQRCVHQAITQLQQLEYCLRAVDYEQLLHIRNEAVANNFYLDHDDLVKQRMMRRSALDVVSAPEAMDMHDTLAALRKLPDLQQELRTIQTVIT